MINCQLIFDTIQWISICYIVVTQLGLIIKQNKIIDAVNDNADKQKEIIDVVNRNINKQNEIIRKINSK